MWGFPCQEAWEGGCHLSKCRNRWQGVAVRQAVAKPGDTHKLCWQADPAAQLGQGPTSGSKGQSAGSRCSNCEDLPAWKALGLSSLLPGSFMLLSYLVCTPHHLLPFHLQSSSNAASSRKPFLEHVAFSSWLLPLSTWVYFPTFNFLWFLYYFLIMSLLYGSSLRNSD